MATAYFGYGAYIKGKGMDAIIYLKQGGDNV
jgi:hypothetical protein